MAMWKSIGNSVAEREGGSGAKVVPLKRALKAQKFLANGRYEMPPLLRQLQGTRKKYVFFAKQDPSRARQNS